MLKTWEIATFRHRHPVSQLRRIFTGQGFLIMKMLLNSLMFGNPMGKSLFVVIKTLCRNQNVFASLHLDNPSAGLYV